MSTLRKQLAALLTPVLPARKYRIVSSLETLDRIAKPTIQFEQSEIAPAPAARGASMVTIKVHVITHRSGVTPAADDSVDELGVEVFEALASISHVNPTIGIKSIYKEQNLSYEIITQVLTKRSTP